MIESADSGDWRLLQGLADDTQAWVSSLGFDTEGWPSQFEELLHGPAADRLWIDADVHGQTHRFALVALRQVDVLVSVSSRRARNSHTGTGNVAANRIQALLAGVGVATTAPYGVVAATTVARLTRGRLAGAHLLDACRQWDIEIACRDLRWDPGADPVGALAVLAVDKAAEAATQLVRDAATRRMDAHGRGVSKWPRSVTSPAVHVHPETGQMSWDRDVCEAAIEAVCMLRNGASWGEAATAIGGRIPSYRLRDEPDHLPGDARPGTRSRSLRNADRRRYGLPELALRYHPDGRPNPAYRPETILDVRQPHVALRNLFLAGTGVAGDYRAIVAQIDTNLEGIHYRDTTLLLLSTGVMRRLQKNQEMSNRMRPVYRYSTYDLGPYRTSGDPYPLTTDDVAFLQGRRTEGVQRRLDPFCPLFAVNLRQPVPVPEGTVMPTGSAAQLDPDDPRKPALSGDLNFHSADNCYIVQLKRTVQPSFTRALGRAPQRVVVRGFLAGVTAALDDLGSARVVSTHPQHGYGTDGRAPTPAASALIDGLESALRSEDLNPTSRQVLEDRLVGARRDALSAQSNAIGTPCGDEVVDVAGLVDGLATLLGGSRKGAPRPGATTPVEQGFVTVLPSERLMQFSCTVTFALASGRALLLPITFDIDNAIHHLSLEAPTCLAWRRRGMALHRSFRHLGITDPVVQARWHDRYVWWLMTMTDLPWVDRRSAELFASCPFDDVAKAGIALAKCRTSQKPAQLVADVRALFFDTGAPEGATWSTAARASSSGAKDVARLLAASRTQPTANRS